MDTFTMPLCNTDQPGASCRRLFALPATLACIRVLLPNGRTARGQSSPPQRTSRRCARVRSLSAGNPNHDGFESFTGSISSALTATGCRSINRVRNGLLPARFNENSLTPASPAARRIVEPRRIRRQVDRKEMEGT